MTAQINDTPLESDQGLESSPSSAETPSSSFETLKASELVEPPQVGIRPKREVSILWVAVPFLIVLLAISVQRYGQSRPTLSGVGKPAPEIELVKLQDNAAFETLASLDQDTVTLVHFWGTWCGPCKMEYPELDEMAGKFRDSSRFQFVSISCESGGNETFQGLTAKTMAYLKSGGMSTLAYADPNGVTRRSAAQRLELNTLYYPTSILVGPDGIIADAWLGYTPESVQQMESRIEDLLAE
ncbi:MAG: TlpA disulfide reductase family protein [Planctomycetota bacterium]